MNPHTPSTALRNRAKSKSKEALLFLLGFAILGTVTYKAWPGLLGFGTCYLAAMSLIGTLLNFSKALTLHADADGALSIEQEPKL